MARRPVESPGDIQLAWRLHSLGLNHEEIAERLGRGERTIDNWLSVAWLKERGPLHLAAGYIDATERCRAGEHDWLKEPEKFPWAVLVEERSRVYSSGATLTQCIHTCRICGEAQIDCGLPSSHPDSVPVSRTQPIIDEE
jgi:hypothetical protein